jgi:hypothetical protein
MHIYQCQYCQQVYIISKYYTEWSKSIFTIKTNVKHRIKRLVEHPV